MFVVGSFCLVSLYHLAHSELLMLWGESIALNNLQKCIALKSGWLHSLVSATCNFYVILCVV